MIVDPPDVSLKSWWHLATQDATLLRALENDRIEALELSGSTLDVGGGQGFGYVDRLRRSGRLDSINLAPEARATFIADLNEVLPIADGAYDNVICFNTVEHLYDDRLILVEILRVLRPGGRFVLTVPFLFRRHGHYGDFHRHTADYWEKVLVEAGMTSDSFRVQPLVWCPLSTALTLLPWFRGGLRGRAAKLLVMAIELTRNAFTGNARSSSRPEDWALGFYIDGVRGSPAPQAGA